MSAWRSLARVGPYNAGMNWQAQFQNDPRFSHMHARVRRHPAWVVKAAVGVALLIVLVPLLAMVLLIALALAVGLLVFVVLSFVASLIESFAALLGGGGGAGPVAPQDDGRRNVRVVDRS